MDDIELFALGGMTNSSGAMFERRRRILNEARKIIATQGLEGLNVRDLCRRADVATRTVYNAFGSKENVIALAIREYFDMFQRRLSAELDLDSFEGALEYTITIVLRNMQVRNYILAVVSLYFSPTIHPNIRAVLEEIGGWSHLRWLRRVKLQRQVEPGVDIDRVAIDLANTQYAILHEWGVGALDDAACLKRTVQAVMLVLSGATRGAARTQARGLFTAAATDSDAFRQLVARAHDRLRPLQNEAAA